MTNQTSSCVWLITGSSTGFGRALAEAALAQGDRVIATARGHLFENNSLHLES